MKKKNNTSNKESPVQKLEEMNWRHIDALDRNKTLFFLPISPLEEHGPHLPVGTDIIVAHDAAKEAIRELQKNNPEYQYVLMPAVPVGYARLGSDFPGTVGVDIKTVKNVIYGICASLARHGFRYVLVCTYHMEIGHLKGIYQGIEKAIRKHNMVIYEPSGPYFYNDEVEKREPKLGFDTKKEVHACFRETSLMKYQYPYLVDESYKTLQSIYINLSAPRVIGKTLKQLGINEGYIGSPARADMDYGRWFFQETVNLYVSSATSLLAGEKLPDLPVSVRLAMKSWFWK